MSHPRRRACLALLLALTTATAVAAGGEAEAKQVRAVVEAQLAAFRADDAQRAFGFATPTIREMFGTAERFMAMVREGYPVVYRPASVAFARPEPGERGGLVQRVHMTDAEGGRWLAIYEMQRLKGQWRINGCVVVRDEAQGT